MINDKDSLFLYLMERFPDFNRVWKSEDNYNVLDDGSFTAAGLCAEFSQYYIDTFNLIDRKCKENLFEAIECILDEAEKNIELVDFSHCIKSCFIENISQTDAGEFSKVFMGPITRKFFDEWHI